MASIQNIKDFCDYQNCALAEYGRLYRTTAMKACIQPLYDSQYELLPFNGTPLHPNANSKKDNNNNNQKPTNQRNSNNRLANTELYKNLKEAGPVRDPGMEDSSHYSHLHPSTTTTSLPDHIKHSKARFWALINSLSNRTAVFVTNPKIQELQFHNN
eukprot:GHVP01003156.1.p1 GENE.GHVP01003156.1~~GHVP01003156.1.p1  ORF type:complete len:157 (-),score=8.79 GHVP01003156.1:36-506(-)